jgi:alkylhydroperoxidase family enzyme
MSARVPPNDSPGLVNGLILRVLGLATGGRPLNVFTTLAHQGSLFRRWLFFAGGLMPGGTLPRRDAELVILRVAHNCHSAYEREQHERIGLISGLSQAEVDATAGGTAELSERQQLLIAACDALHADRDVDDALWARLEAEFGGKQCMELFLLIGHYEMLAMTLNSLRVEPDAPTGPPSKAMKTAQRLLRRD